MIFLGQKCSLMSHKFFLARMIFFGQKCSSMSQNLFINKLRYAMGKEMTINKTPFGVGLALETRWTFLSKMFINEPKNIHK